MDFTKKPERDSLDQGANPISRLFMLWMAPFLWNGMKNGLTTNDLTKCMPKDRSDILGDDLEKAWKRELKTSTKYRRKPRLWRVLFRKHGFSFIFYGFLHFLDVAVIRTVRAPVLGQFIHQFQKPVNINELSIDKNNQMNNTEDLMTPDLYRHVNNLWNDPFWLATGLVLLSVFSFLLKQHAYIGLSLLGSRMRASCCSLIYRKSLRLSASEANGTSSGYVVNLISNDLARLDDALLYINFLWILPIQILFILFLIWKGSQWAAIFGIIALFLQTIPLHTLTSYFTALLRKRIALLTDNRVGIMNELIQGIQVIKMYAWETPFRKIIGEARRLEIKQIRYASYIRGIDASTSLFVGKSTTFILIAIYIIMGYKLSAGLVYSLSQYFTTLQMVTAFYYPLAVSSGAEALVSLRRVEKFLLKEENTETGKCVQPSSSTIDPDEKPHAIDIYDVNASWDRNSTVNTLSQITLQIKRGQLFVIVGPVGEGKSSLIQLLLGELPVQSGKMFVNGSISYAAQEPWIFFGTVRNNILFGENYDKQRYSEIVKCCALTTDFKQMSYGDKTIIGDRGASLSGGQRARISLARAMYKKASIYLLDDPLSAVDAHVGKHLFDHVIGPNAGIAKSATRVLVTHQVHFLKEADVIVIMESGQITHQGTFAELSESDVDFAKLLERINQNDKMENEQDDKVLDSDEHIYETSKKTSNIERTLDGKTYVELKQRSKSIASIASIASQELNCTQPEEEEEKLESGLWKIIVHFFSVASSRLEISFLLVIIVLARILVGVSDYYVKFITTKESMRETSPEGLLTQMEYLYIYAAIIFALTAIYILREVYFYRICMRSSKALHDKMFSNIMQAPMRFFNINQTGRIQNRFSKDMGVIDERLPSAMFGSILYSNNLVGSLIMICIIGSQMVANVLVVLIVFGLLVTLFLRSTQDLQRLEGICRSPVFSHLTASINGLATIRSRSIQRKLCQEFDDLQTVHSSVWQLTRLARQTFGLWLNSLCAAFLASVAFSYIFFYRDATDAIVALVVSEALNLSNSVMYAMQIVMESIQQMTSVERIVQYTEVEPEHGPTKRPPTDWPNEGKIKMQNMSLYYDLKDSPILKHITLEIQAGSKIGVVGRTGAGKSSLISALFRLTYIDGLIEIDGIDTGTIALDNLRSKISIIPQNPVLFSGTIRRNLDPFEKYSDDDIWKTLDVVQLKGIVSFSGGLNMPVMSNGSNLSVGQRQLVCLARAILRNNRILVIDEATANCDYLTDQMIQKTIRQQFADCTVLTVAHRLNTIIDSDRILVLDAGECVEFDTPINLLTKTTGIFKEMIDALGSDERDHLYSNVRLSKSEK